MSGGDLLYILAFIILPTAVLVSCVWALILLRKGVLLPIRPRTAHDISHEMDMPDTGSDALVDPVEETGEHRIASPSAAGVAPNASARAGADRASSADGDSGVEIREPANEAHLGAATLAAGEPSPSERTQEMAALPLELPSDGREPDRVTVRRHEDSSRREPVAAVEAEVAAAPLARADVGESPDLLMVPLEEQRPPAHAAGGLHDTDLASEPPERAGSDGGAGLPPTAESGRRKPVRRMVKSAAAESPPPRPRPRAGQRRSQREQGR